MEDASDVHIGGLWTNAISRALSSEMRYSFKQKGRYLDISPGEYLYRKYEPIQYVYFPASGIVSLVFLTSDGNSSGLALTGRDGIVGFPLVLGQERACHDAVVQNPGRVFRLSRQDFTSALEMCPEFRRAATAYVRSIIAQMQSGLVCSHHFRVEEQLARWLLLSFDRAATDRLLLTQQILADMLGVRREAVNEAARSLSERHFIRYRRGWIDLLDREGLRCLASECYGNEKQSGT